MTWRATTLGELVRIEHGFAFKGEFFAESGRQILLTPGNFHEEGGFRPRPGKDRYYAGEFPERYVLERHALIVAMTEQGEGLLGSAALVPDAETYLHNQRIGRVKERRELADRRFLYYLFNTDHVRQQIRNSSSGTKVRHTSPERMYSAEVTVPDVELQRKIAAILSAYDDLIANNQRRIALLESMAEEIYREWLVRMRFPGHQGVSKEKGLPFGWSLKPFAQVVEINPSERPAKVDEHPFVAMDELSIDSMYFSTKVRRKGNSGSRFRNSDVLFPRITPSLENGKRGFVMCLEEDDVGVGSTEFIVMREHEISAEHIYFLTCSDDFRKHAEISMVGASGRQRVNEGCFSFFLVAVPPARERSAFTDTVRPMFVEIGNLAKQNALLESTRDALLPRLISGKLKVDHLDIQLPPSMR